MNWSSPIRPLPPSHWSVDTVLVIAATPSEALDRIFDRFPWEEAKEAYRNQRYPGAEALREFARAELLPSAIQRRPSPSSSWRLCVSVFDGRVHFAIIEPGRRPRDGSPRMEGRRWTGSEPYLALESAP